MNYIVGGDVKNQIFDFRVTHLGKVAFLIIEIENRKIKGMAIFYACHSPLLSDQFLPKLPKMAIFEKSLIGRVSKPVLNDVTTRITYILPLNCIICMLKLDIF